MSKIDRKIRELRHRHRLTQGEFAEAIGVKQSTISRWESGAQEPEFSAIKRIADWANINAWEFALEDEHHFRSSSSVGIRVSVIGLIKANEWYEKPELDSSDQFEVDIPILYDFGLSVVGGYIVKDSSCEPRFPVNSVVFIDKSAEKIIHDTLVIVSRQDERGLYETTLREVYINKDGVIYLSPITDDPSIAMPFRLDQKEIDISDGYDLIQRSDIKGILIASFIVEGRSSYLG